MRTTLDLPQELMLAVRVRAAEKNRKLKDVVAELLWLGLASASAARPAVRNRVRLPLVECAQPVVPDQELTPDRVAIVLADREASDLAAL
ncbi:MAG: hypothetical protein OXN89_10325 [Bryobacterales bacterium]|nr:hypothetical protein [Bryobacterales bacterium]